MSKIICSNCGCGYPQVKYKAMAKAGYMLHHIACGVCGVQALVTKEYNDYLKSLCYLCAGRRPTVEEAKSDYHRQMCSKCHGMY